MREMRLPLHDSTTDLFCGGCRFQVSDKSSGYPICRAHWDEVLGPGRDANGRLVVHRLQECIDAEERQETINLLREQLFQAQTFAARQRDRAVLAESDREEMAHEVVRLREEAILSLPISPRAARHLVGVNFSIMCECDHCEDFRSSVRAMAKRGKQ